MLEQAYKDAIQNAFNSIKVQLEHHYILTANLYVVFQFH